MTTISFAGFISRAYIIFYLLLFKNVHGNENTPELLMTKRVLSTLPQIPNVIKSQLEGKSDGIREMVATVLGDGLLSKLVVSPMKALEMKTNSNKGSKTVKNADLDSRTIIAPNTLDPVKSSNEISEKPKNVETRREKTDLAELLSNGEEQLFVDGRPVKSEETVIKAYEVNRNPNEPEKMLKSFRDDNRTKQLPSETAEIMMSLKKSPKTKTTRNPGAGFPAISTPPPQAVAETLLTALKQFFGNDDATVVKNTVAPQQPVSQLTTSGVTLLPGELSAGPAVPALALSDSRNSQVDFTKIDPSRLSEIYSLMGATTRPEFLGSVSNIRRSDLKNSIDALLLSLRSRDISELSIDEVKSLQGYLQSYEQSLQTKELLYARKKLQMIQSELDEQKLKIQEQKFQEEQLKMQAARLEEQRRRMEEQLQRQLSSWHGAFKTLNTQEVPSPSNFLDSIISNTKESSASLSPGSSVNGIPAYKNLETTASTKIYGDGVRRGPERDAAFLIDKKPLLQNFARDEKPLEKIIGNDIALTSNMRTTSSLERQLRYAPDNKQASAASRVLLANNATAMDCSCEDVDISKLRGTWLQTLSSKLLLKSLYSAVASIFDEDDEVELSCSDLKISGSDDAHKNQRISYVWTFRTINSDRSFRISGNISKGSNHILYVSGENFSRQEFYFPVCILKAGLDSNDEYEYVTAVNPNEGCNSATLLVKNPENFFNKPDVLLIQYLRKKIAIKEMDEMDVVSHGKSCLS